jgi:hypothetical protein
MDETGARVEADPAAAQGERGTVQMRQLHAWRADVCGFRDEMHTARRRSVPFFLQPLVRLGRAEAGKNLERALRLDAARQSMQEIDKAGIDPLDFIEMVIPHEPVDAGKRGFDIRPLRPVDVAKRFSRVRIHHMQGSIAVARYPGKGGSTCDKSSRTKRKL